MSKDNLDPDGEKVYVPHRPLALRTALQAFGKTAKDKEKSWFHYNNFRLLALFYTDVTTPILLM